MDQERKLAKALIDLYFGDHEAAHSEAVRLLNDAAERSFYHDREGAVYAADLARRDEAKWTRVSELITGDAVGEGRP